MKQDKGWKCRHSPSSAWLNASFEFKTDFLDQGAFLLFLYHLWPWAHSSTFFLCQVKIRKITSSLSQINVVNHLHYLIHHTHHIVSVQCKLVISIVGMPIIFYYIHVVISFYWKYSIFLFSFFINPCLQKISYWGFCHRMYPTLHQCEFPAQMSPHFHP